MSEHMNGKRTTSKSSIIEQQDCQEAATNLE